MRAHLIRRVGPDAVVTVWLFGKYRDFHFHGSGNVSRWDSKYGIVPCEKNDMPVDRKGRHVMPWDA